tara:strand:- start:447 stop:554 length:108 start_codon:yes stop_codon:yes gene_type:complete
MDFTPVVGTEPLEDIGRKSGIVFPIGTFKDVYGIR